MVKKTRKCKTCGTELEIDIGVHNWKNLFRKPTLDEYIMLFIILMTLFSYYQYNKDINTLREYYEDGDYCSYIIQLNNPEPNTNSLNLLDNLDLSNNSLVLYDEEG